MSSEFFDSVVRWNVERKGSKRLLPYRYYDNLWIAGIYTAATSIVRGLIPAPQLRPIELFPGRCLVAIAFFDYKKPDEEPYKETSISFLVEHQKRPLPAISVLNMIRSRVYSSYIWQLPLTAEYHRAGGVDLYGYPKFLADIDISAYEDRIECTLSKSGRLIIRMTGQVLPTKAGREMRFATYAVDGDVLIKANVIINPIQFAESHRKSDLVLEIGDNHGICETLRSIKLSSHPLLYQYSPYGESMLFPGRNAIDA